MATPLERARSLAAQNTFDYIYRLRHKRGAHRWEWIIGEALLTGQMTIVRPPDDPILRTIHQVVDAVELALGLAEVMEEIN